MTPETSELEKVVIDVKDTILQTIETVEAGVGKISISGFFEDVKGRIGRFHSGISEGEEPTPPEGYKAVEFDVGLERAKHEDSQRKFEIRGLNCEWANIDQLRVLHNIAGFVNQSRDPQN